MNSRPRSPVLVNTGHVEWLKGGDGSYGLMVKVRHAYDRGIGARRGIDF